MSEIVLNKEFREFHDYTPVAVSGTKRMLSSVAEKIYDWKLSRYARPGKNVSFVDKNSAIGKIMLWYLGNGVFRYDVGDVLKDTFPNNYNKPDAKILGMAKNVDGIDFYALLLTRTNSQGIVESNKTINDKSYIERNYKRISSSTIENKLGG